MVPSNRERLFVGCVLHEAGWRNKPMGLFATMMQKIFHASAAAEAPPDVLKPGDSGQSRVQEATQAAPSAPAATMPATSPMSSVDVAATLDKMAASHGEKLDWKHSIVDLMKILGMDSSLSARKELAADLHYTGDTNDSATMNIWLHKEVMRKLSENGGKVPADLMGH